MIIKPFAIGLTVMSMIIGISVVGGSFYTIDQTDRGVILRNGALTGTAEPGLGFKLPFIDSVIEIPVNEHVKVFGGSPETDLQVYSYDQQPAGFRVSVNYTIPAGQVDLVYTKFKGVDGLESVALNPKVYKATKEVFGKYTAVRAIQDRTTLGSDIQTRLMELVDGDPITINSVQIENIDFSDAYEQSVEQRMLAQVAVEKAKQNYEQNKVEAQNAVVQAEAAASATVASAKAKAESTRLAGEAEAAAIKAKGDALAQNPGLVQLIQAENWNGQLPTTMVPGSAVPFLNMPVGK